MYAVGFVRLALHARVQYVIAGMAFSVGCIPVEASQSFELDGPVLVRVEITPNHSVLHRQQVNRELEGAYGHRSQVDPHSCDGRHVAVATRRFRDVTPHDFR